MVLHEIKDYFLSVCLYIYLEDTSAPRERETALVVSCSKVGQLKEGRELPEGREKAQGIRCRHTCYRLTSLPGIPYYYASMRKKNVTTCSVKGLLRKQPSPQSKGQRVSVHSDFNLGPWYGNMGLSLKEKDQL